MARSEVLMFRRTLLLALVLSLGLVLPARAGNDEEIHRLVGSIETAHRVSGDWALAFWSEPRGKGGDGVTLLRRADGRWAVVKTDVGLTREQLLGYRIPEGDLANLGYGEVPPELVHSLAFEAASVKPRPSEYRVATYGRSRFALTNQGDIWSGKQVVWERVQEKWHPIFSYDGGHQTRESRSKLYAREGLSPYMLLLLNFEGQAGHLPAP
jgi:hypothetical protein